MQKYTSKNTSVNTTKLPAVYSKINWDKLPKHILSVLDWGCGRDTSYLQEWLEVYPRIRDYIRYDPNWCSKEENAWAQEVLGYANIFICSNVLNVIDDDKAIEDICRKAAMHKIYFITVYEGDKTGVGKKSKDDCWQRNEKAKAYLIHFPNSELFGTLTIKKGVITNRPDLIK
jgi:hypothetical protein